CRQLVLEIDEGKPGHAACLEFDEDVHVAVRAEIVAQRGTKEGEPPYVVLAAEVRDPVAVDGDRVWHLPDGSAADRFGEVKAIHSASSSSRFSAGVLAGEAGAGTTTARRCRT